MKTIKAINQTILKKEVAQASELEDNQKVQVPEGKTYEILNHEKAERGHYKVELNYDAGTWYVWSGHWELPWEEQTISSGAVSSVSQTWKDINWHDFDAKVSKYFTVREVTNGDTCRIPSDDTIKQNIFTLAQELDKVREAWGSGIIVTSWYRPLAVNKKVGGAKTSQHIQGSAVDIKPCNGKIYKFQDWLDKEIWQDKALGYGAKKGFVHIDLRLGHIRWPY